MKLSLFLVLFFVLPTVPSCAITGTKVVDGMCPEIIRFAASTQPGDTSAVTLRGGWGGDDGNTLMTHDCRHSGDDSSRALCAYLGPNTSWEFGERNARRAIACLDSGNANEALARLERGDEPVEITSTLRGAEDQGVLVTVRFNYPKPPGTLTVLEISATRSGAP